MANKNEPRERRWQLPNKRAKSFAEERKAKVHQHGDKEGQQLTEYEAGLRSGYLMNQSDRAGLYKYIEAIKEGKSKEEAIRLSRIIGKPNKKEKNSKK